MKLLNIQNCWEDRHLRQSFIPSLLHAWDMKLDKIAELELSYFLNLSDNEYHKNNRKSDVKKEPFLKNP